MFLRKVKTAVAVTLVFACVGLGGVFSVRSADGGAVPAEHSRAEAGPEDNLKNTLLALDRHLREASARGDWRERGKFYADDMVTISVLGKNGKADNVAADQRLRCTDRTVADAEVVPTGKNTAVLCYRYSCKVTSNDGTVVEDRKDYRVTYVWANRAGGWVIVFCFDDHGRKAGVPEDLRLRFNPNEWGRVGPDR
jgi:ketosteroid isomerase-like protein